MHSTEKGFQFIFPIFIKKETRIKYSYQNKTANIFKSSRINGAG